MKILYVSLFPESNSCHEIKNLEYFMTTTKYYETQDAFTYRLFSCYDETVKNLKEKFNCPISTDESLFNFDEYKIKVERLYFNFKDDMNDKLLHEVAWSKEKLFSFVCFDKVINNFDFIFYNDSDIKIDSNDVYNLCKILEVKNKIEKDKYFVNIPYVLRDKKYIIDASFGSHVIPTDILKELPDTFYKNIYSVYEKDGIIYRIDSPDFIIRKKLLNLGYKEMRGESCNTKHYVNNDNYYECESRRIAFN